MTEERKDDAERADETRPDKDGAMKWLETDEGKRWLSSEVDRTVQKALKTHDEKRQPEIDKMLEEARKEARTEGEMSAAERLERKVAELATKLDAAEKAKTRQDTIARLYKEAEQRSVPLELAVDLDNPNLDFDKSVSRIETWAKDRDERDKQLINKSIAENSHKPGSGEAGDNKDTGLPYDPNDMSPENMAKAIAYAEDRLKSEEPAVTP